MRLSDAQIDLYSRQIILREVGGTGQQKLLAARCLVRGGGAAAEMALSYLVGAGIGAIDVIADDAAVASSLPLAALARRSPDSVVRRIAGSAAETDGYDVTLAFRGAGESDETPAERARLGAIAARTCRDGAVAVLLVPRVAGCLACTTDAGSDTSVASDAPRAADPVDLAAAGALAALACCRWLAGIGHDAEPRALRLAPGSALWVEGAAERRASCPRGCPP